MVSIETWIDEKNWRKIKGMLPKGYMWVKQMTIKISKKGRLMRDMIMGIRKGELR